MPKQITLEEIIQKFKLEFVKDLGPNVEPVFSDPVGQVGPVMDFITTYFTEFAESLRLEKENAISETIALSEGAYEPSLEELAFEAAYNRAKAILDKRVDAALNKPSI